MGLSENPVLRAAVLNGVQIVDLIAKIDGSGRYCCKYNSTESGIEILPQKLSRYDSTIFQRLGAFN